MAQNEEPPYEVRLDVRVENTWSARRAQDKPEEKIFMARHFASHAFLVQEGHSPEVDPRKTVASILVNQGTTPNIIVQHALEWLIENQHSGPFDLTWYTPGHLVPATLRQYREEHPHLSSATHLFLFPGRVDLQTESVSGREAEEFCVRLNRCFSYALLSAYAFDIRGGTAYFHLPEEIALQRGCATRYASEKFLFLDSTKFRKEGEAGYTVTDMLDAADSVTIYTASSEKDEWLVENFIALCEKVLDSSPRSRELHKADLKTLRLRIIGRVGTPTQCVREGLLREGH